MATNFKISTNDLESLYITEDSLDPRIVSKALESTADNIPGMRTYRFVGNIITNSSLSPTWFNVDTNLKYKQRSAMAAKHTILADDNNKLIGWGGNSSYRIDYKIDPDILIPINLGFDQIESVAGGTSHNAIIKTDGGLWTCGLGSSGQLGHGDTLNQTTWARVGTLSWKQASGGSNYVTAIRSDNTLWSWGWNGGYQLGLGNTLARSSPAQVGTLSNWKQVSAGLDHTAGILYTGALLTWGTNDSGKLGQGNTLSYSTPVQVGTLSNWDNVNASIYNTFAVKTDGTLWVWGDFSAGGDGSGSTQATVDKSSPVQIGSATNWKKVAGYTLGYSALKTDGTLWRNGYNLQGTLGDGTTVNKSSLIQIGTQTDWSDIFHNDYQAFAIKTDGTLWANGIISSADYVPNSGDGTTIARSSPVQIGAGVNWKTVGQKAFDVTSDAMIAVSSDGYLYGWGNQAASYVEWGVPIHYNYDSAVEIDVFSKVSISETSTIDMGRTPEGQVIIDTAGDLWVWGGNASGQLGDGTTLDVYRPKKLYTPNNKWSFVHSAPNNTYAITTTGELWAIGNGPAGKLGDGTVVSKSSLIQVGKLTDWLHVSADSHVLALKTDGTLWSWGLNTYGELGLGNTLNHSSPVQVTGTNWNKIATSGISSSYAIKTDGTLWSWGLNNTGQLGLGDTLNVSIPTIVSGTNWSHVTAGDYHTAAIKTDGTLWAWGINGNGQLGQGDIVSRSTPVQIGTLTTWKDARAASNGWILAFDGIDLFHIGSVPGSTIKYSSPTQIGTQTTWKKLLNAETAIDTFGNLWKYGEAAGFRLGNYSETDVGFNMVKTINNAKIYQTEAAGNSTYILDEDGHLFTAGLNDDGQLGDGLTVAKSNNLIPVLYDVNQIAGGSVHLVALMRDGTHVAFGKNTAGQLGLGDTISRSSPSMINAPADGGWDFISNGYNHTVALRNGSIWSWGLNTYGQLGDGTVVNTSSPIRIGSLNNWTKINTCNTETIGLRSDGTLWMWGRNNSGQLGQNDVTLRSSPVQVLGSWIDIAGDAPNISAYAIRSDGTLWAWGSNTLGQLGDGDTLNRSSPVQVSTSITNWKLIKSTNTFVGGITTTGQLWMWGNGGSGRLGDGFTLSRSTPVRVGTLSDWSKLTLGGSNTVAIKTDGTLWSWGGARSGVIGLNNLINYSSPMQIGSLNDWAEVSTGLDFTFAIKTDGTLWGWGNGADYNIIDGLNINRSSPVQVGFKNDWVSISTGYYNNASAIDSKNNLYTWGHSIELGDGGASRGMLGNGTAAAVQIFYPQLLNYDIGCIREINSGNFQTFLTKHNGDVYATGSAGSGKTGLNTVENTTQFVNRNRIIAIDSSSNSNIDGHIAFIKADGTMWAVGSNTITLTACGQLGDGTTVNRSSPVLVLGGGLWKYVETGSNATYGIKNDGTLWSWGAGGSGRLGIGSTVNVSTPVQIAGGGTWEYVDSVATFGLGKKTDGTYLSWGDNTYGQLGTGLTVNVSTPVQIIGTSYKNVVTSLYAMHALKTDGTLWGWGRNLYGQLGNGNTLDVSTPVQCGSASDWDKISSGNENAAAIKTDGTLWAWGSNSSGQLGKGNTLNVSTPVKIGTLSDWISISNNVDMSSAINRHNELWVWGLNDKGGLGLGDTINRSSPVRLGTMSHWKSASIRRNSYAIDMNDNVYVFGYNGSDYALGLGDTVDRSIPVMFGGQDYSNPYVTSLTTGDSMTVQIRDTGTMWACGDGSLGRLGIGVTTNRSSPTQIGTLSEWNRVYSGSDSVYALNKNGTLWSWGANAEGQLGLGDTTDRSSPVQIGSINNYYNVITLESGAILESRS